MTIPTGELRARLRELPFRGRLEDHQDRQEPRHQLPRQDQVPAARRPYRRRLPKLPWSVSRPAGEVQGARLRRMQRLPRGRAPRAAPPEASGEGRGLRLVSHRQRLRAGALRGGTTREHEVPTRRRARRVGLPRLSPDSTTGSPLRVTAAVHKFLRERKRPERFSLAVLHPKKSPQACAECHEDVHRGQFLQRRRARTIAPLATRRPRFPTCGSTTTSRAVFRSPASTPRPHAPVATRQSARRATA